MLWNPIKRKALLFRPEELVRMRVIEYLLLETRISASRIAVEAPVPARHSRGRTDVVCYDAGFRPWILIECKAESVPPGQAAALQAAVYNRHVKAPYILLTNGYQDALYDTRGELTPIPTESYPREIRKYKPFVSLNPEYWKGRGFLAGNLTGYDSGLSSFLAMLFHSGNLAYDYMSLSFPYDSMPLHHYYAMVEAPGPEKTVLALTMMALNRQDTLFCLFANREGNNISSARILVDTDGNIMDSGLYRISKAKETSGQLDKLPASAIRELQNLWQDPLFLKKTPKSNKHFLEALLSAIGNRMFS